MAILKLAVGAPIVMTVTGYAIAEGQFGPQIKFDGEDGDVLFIGKDTADRQMERIGNVVPPETLRFEKVQKGTKTFINIDKVSGAVAKNGTAGGALPRPAVPTTTAPAAPVSRPEVVKVLDLEETTSEGASGYKLYEAVTRKVLANIPPLYAAAGIPISAEAAAAAIATVFIQASRK